MSREWKSSEDTRRKILAGARAAFARGGYDGTSMREICAACGFQQPSVYHHFQNKANLFRTILFESHDRLLVAVRTGLVTDQNDRVEVQSIFDAINRFHKREPTHLYLTFRLVFSAPPPLQREFARNSSADYFRFLKAACQRHKTPDRRRRLGLLNDLLRSFLLGLAAPAMREGKSLDKRAAIAFILRD